jgi:hypothetical protein
MKLTSFNSLSDLTAIGIEMLTGESDKLGIRLLCDVTEEGKVAVCRALGVNDIQLAPPWNSKGIGSVLPTRDMLELIALVYMVEHCEDGEIWQEDNGRLTHVPAQDLIYIKTLNKIHPNALRHYPCGPTRNQHQMSRRIE